MDRPIYGLFLVPLLLTIATPARADLADVLSTAKEQADSCWKPGLYDRAIASLQGARKAYLAADSTEKARNAERFAVLNYDLARAWALTNRADSAVTCLQRTFDLTYATYSTYYREIDYFHIVRDTALAGIRGNPAFQAVLARFKHAGWEDILDEFPDYRAVDSRLPPFIYVDGDWEGLPELRKKYRLDDVAGSGDDVSRAIHLMKWVHDTIGHDGNSGEPADRHADALIELARKEKRGLNCWMLATVLNEVYLATGFKSRIVSCYPKGDPSITHEWHVINEVYSPSRHKWLWMDPSLATWVADDRGNLLSIAEVRKRLIEGAPVHAAPGMNWNGEAMEGGEDRYLHDYMMKNLFRLSIPLYSIPAYEMCPRKTRIYVELLPDGYNPRHVRMNEITGKYSSTIYTTDDRQFWAAPEGG